MWQWYYGYKNAYLLGIHRKVFIYEQNVMVCKILLHNNPVGVVDEVIDETELAICW